MKLKHENGKKLFIFQAAFEYLISLLVTTSFLAKLTSEIGMSDSLTGVVSSFISLGCLFQLFSVFLQLKKSKSFVTTLSILNQLLFLLLYVIPLFGIKKEIKILFFIVVVFIAYIIYNFAHPKKINWLMSLVDDNSRGKFTANKEIISLIVGMIFSFAMGVAIDYFADMGKISTAFLLSAVVIFLLTVLHTLTLILTVEIDIPTVNRKKSIKSVLSTLKNKEILTISMVFVIYYISKDVTIPFYGTYKLNELGMSLKFVTFLTILSSVTRVLVSRYWGMYADKNSFARMIEKCFIIMAISYLFIVFATPSNGKVMFVLYYILYGISMGGVNSALINLIFDYVAPDKRADSLAVSQAVSGLAGFLSTLAISPLVTIIQNNQNKIFGITIYAQQILSFVGFIFMLLAIIYVRIVLIKKINSKFNAI